MIKFILVSKFETKWLNIKFIAIILGLSIIINFQFPMNNHFFNFFPFQSHLLSAPPMHYFEEDYSKILLEQVASQNKITTEFEMRKL